MNRSTPNNAIAHLLKVIRTKDLRREKLMYKLLLLHNSSSSKMSAKTY